jgi:hypothetical protein
VWRIITDDDHIVDLLGTTKALRSALQYQLTTYKTDVLNGRPEDADWHGRTKALYVGIVRLEQSLGPKVKARNIRHYDQLARLRYKMLRTAIIAHQETTLASGEATEQDRLLWMALEETWAMGSDEPQPRGRVAAATGATALGVS